MRSYKRAFILLCFLVISNLLGTMSADFSLDIAILVLVLLTPFWLFSYKKYSFRPLIVFMAIALLSVIRSYVNYGQDILSTIAPLRVWFIGFSLTIVIISWPKSIRKVRFSNHYLILSAGLILLAYHVVIFSFDLSSMLDGIETRYRDGSVRFLVLPWTTIFLVIHFYLSEKVLLKLLSFSLFGVLLFIAQTRSILAAVIATIILGESLRFISNKLVIRRRSVLLLGSIVFATVFSFSKLIVLFGFGGQAVESENGLIRIAALEYYSSKMTYLDWILGRGIINKKVSTDFISDRFFLADIGGFEIIHNHGIVVLLILVVFYLAMFLKYNKTSDDRAVAWFFLCQLLMLPFISVIYSLEAIVLNGILLGYRIKND